MKTKRFLFLAVVSAVLGAGAVTPGPGTHYATDAFPGFDDASKILPQEKKTPSLFWWRNAKRPDPASQLQFARALAAEGSYSSARTAYNALIAQWPSAGEAPVAQRELADLLLDKIGDSEEAFEEFKYLADFYSSQCDYESVIKRMYAAASDMREKGKKIVFFPFSNSADVRRAFEDVVRRASGADFAPQAMLFIAELRTEDGEYPEAIAVYKTIRNRYPASKAAKTALGLEADLRMRMLRNHEYNRERSKRTLSFMNMAVKMAADPAERERFSAWCSEISKLMEKEAYESTVFYDSVTRTRRSAISACESFLRNYPASGYAPDVRMRLSRLKGESK